jgi:putative pyoverdin transport system ATP-binding/permease protein
MDLISFLLKSSWKMVAIAIITGFVSGSSSAGLIALISRAFSDNIISPWVGWGFIVLAIVALISSIITRIILISLSQNAVFQLQMRLSRQILLSELRHLETLGSPKLLATLTEDIQTISNAVYVLPFLFINLAIVTGCFVYIIWLSWQVFLAVALLTLISLVSCRFLLKKGREFLVLARNEQDLLFKHFRTITEGIKELKLNYQRRQAFFNQDLETTADQYRNYNSKGLTFFAMTDSWGKLIFFFAIGLVLFILPRFINLNLQTLSGYVLTFTFIIGPMENIVNKLPLISKANIALQKIKMLGFALGLYAETKLADHQLKQPPDILHNWKQLTFKKVTHTYKTDLEDRDFILGPIELEFKPGELIFIVGGNGSGKSTLAKIITGLYDPEAGEIWLDKILIDGKNREWYREHFSVIFADFFLFDKLLGFETKNLDFQAKNYLKQLQLDHKVKIEAGQLSTISLSQGQRKRLALLTAYLEDRPIYLFDEWAADQDPVFKKIFYTQFLPELKEKGKTILVISHDDQYFDLADRLIKLDYGKVINY